MEEKIESHKFKLMPCPFCGKTPELWIERELGWYTVRCVTPKNMCIRPFVSDNSAFFAVARWNTRGKTYEHLPVWYTMDCEHCEFRKVETDEYGYNCSICTHSDSGHQNCYAMIRCPENTRKIQEMILFKREDSKR